MKKSIATTFWVHVDENQYKQSPRVDYRKKRRETWRPAVFQQSRP